MISGIVQEKRASIGEYMAAGAPVVSIVRMDPLRLRAAIRARISRLKPVRVFASPLIVTQCLRGRSATQPGD